MCRYCGSTGAPGIWTGLFKVVLRLMFFVIPSSGDLQLSRLRVT
jgi:hypothetical protein